MWQDMDLTLAEEMILCKDMLKAKKPGSVRRTKMLIAKLKQDKNDRVAEAVDSYLKKYIKKYPKAT